MSHYWLEMAFLVKSWLLSPSNVARRSILKERYQKYQATLCSYLEIHPLSNEFDGRLGTVHFQGRHVQVINEENHSLSKRRSKHTLTPEMSPKRQTLWDCLIALRLCTHVSVRRYQSSDGRFAASDVFTQILFTPIRFLLLVQQKISFKCNTEKFPAANRPSDDWDRSRMHMNTPTEINGTQKNRIRRWYLTFACMCT